MPPTVLRRVWASRLWVVVCVAAAIALTACGTAKPTPLPVTITFAHPDSDNAYYQAMAKAYQLAYPHVTIRLVPRSQTQMNGLLFGDADAFVSSSILLDQLLSKGMVLDLSQLMDLDATLDTADFYPGTLELFHRQGRRLGIPAGLDPYVMYYNQDLFDKAGVPYPTLSWTWDDFQRAGRAISNPAAGVFGYVSRSTLEPVLFVYQRGGRIFDQWPNPTRTTFTDPLTVAAVEWYADLVLKHEIAPTAEHAKQFFNNQPERGIYDKRIAMWMGAFSERGGMTWRGAQWLMKWGMAPLPHSTRSATAIWAEGFYISSATRNVDAAWRWLSFLSKKMPTRLVPARRSLVASPEYAKQAGENIAAVAQAALQADSVFLAASANLEAFANAIGEVLAGRLTARDAMIWAQQQAQK